jgi:hypothetical protein
MQKTAIRQALICALVGPALLVAVSPAFAQFCAPPDREGSAPRFYCLGGPAWASHQSAQQTAEPHLDIGTSSPPTAVVPMLHQ